MWHKILCLMIIVGLLGGCATTDSGRTKVEGTAIGAGVGAGVGAVVGYILGGKQGALIGAGAGAALGGAAGYAWGAHVASKKEQYASQEDYLDAVIASARQVNENTQQYNASLTSDIDKIDREANTLVRQYNEKKIQKAALEAKRKETETKAAEAKKQLAAVNTEIEIQQKVLKQEKSDVKSAQAQNRLNAMETEVSQLEQRRDELGRRIDALAAIGVRVKV